MSPFNSLTAIDKFSVQSHGFGNHSKCMLRFNSWPTRTKFQFVEGNRFNSDDLSPTDNFQAEKNQILMQSANMRWQWMAACAAGMISEEKLCQLKIHDWKLFDASKCALKNFASVVLMAHGDVAHLPLEVDKWLCHFSVTKSLQRTTDYCSISGFNTFAPELPLENFKFV